MGAIGLFSSSSYDEPKRTPNPDPMRYTILQSEQVGKYCVLTIQYHGCLNYEGQKILVYEAWLEELKNQPALDPHFSENTEYYSPIARFEPTVTGWKNAITFCKAIQ